jgi:Leucine-rich repeat (LRR) protein
VGTKPAPVDGKKKPLFFQTPGFDDWVKQVAAMPVEQQVEAVSKKLVELNPGFDGKLFEYKADMPPKIENGAVTQLGFHSNSVTDISPVRVFKQLKVLRCDGLRSQSKFADLSPLEGMRVGLLYCSQTSVRDLSPLKGMQLNSLFADGSQVSDLSVLAGMPLTKVTLGNTPVTDIAPLESCRPLKTLLLNGTRITPNAVTALQKALPNCKIEWDDPTKPATSSKLFIHDPAFPLWMKEVQAMSAEEQVKAVSKKLMELNPGFDGNLKSDLYGTPRIESGVVTGLHIFSDNVKDISPVRALVGLRLFGCGGEGLADLSPLKGLSFMYFGYQGSGVTNLQALRGQPLKTLHMQATQISDLSPLAGMPLEQVGISNCPRISDISQLKGMKLHLFRCVNTQVSDLSPLKDMPLKSLDLDFKSERDTNLLRSIKTLETINNKPVAEFWKEVEGKKPLFFQTPAFEQWVKDVQAMPAEKQLETVSKKLVELNPGFDGKLMGTDASSTPKIEGEIVRQVGFFTENVTDISPVRALNGLRSLACIGSGIDKSNFADLSPLNGLSLTELWCHHTSVSDLSPLEGMPLTMLDCGTTRVSSLLPLKGMPLATLKCSESLVADLSPISGVKLTYLSCSSSKVTDLSPLKGMALKTLYCDGLSITDLSPLTRMPLVGLRIPRCMGVRDLSPLSECKDLKSLNALFVPLTASSVAALQKALPNCKVEWDDPSKAATQPPQ